MNVKEDENNAAVNDITEAKMRNFEDKANDMSTEDLLFWVSGKNKEDWLEEMRQRTR